MLSGLVSLEFCCHIWMVVSEFGLNNMKEWIYPALYQQFRLLLIVLEILSWHSLVNGLLIYLIHLFTLPEHSKHFIENAIHTFFLRFSAFYLTLTRIHTLMDASERKLGLVSCPKVFSLQSGAARDRTF